MQRNKRLFVLALLFCHSIFLAAAQNSTIIVSPEFLPTLETLNPRIPIPEEKKSIQNFVFSDFMADVNDAGKKIAAGKAPTPTFYRYRAVKGDTILSVSARLNIPQETLATANHLDSADAELAGRELILPTVPGVFIPLHPKNTLEILLAKEFAPLLSGDMPVYALRGTECYFLTGKRLTPTQRLFFLDTSMKMPLTDMVLTSDFGYRVSPITNTWKFHSGVDLAAPTGTSVFACKNGTVQSAVRGDPIFGNYIILSHQKGITSVYAHLSKILVEKGQTVKTGEEIGKVGTTGASTGPHLHFEVRQDGRPTNPLKN